MKPIWYPLFFLIWLAVAIKVVHYNWGWWIDAYSHKFSAVDLWVPLILGVLISFMALIGAMGLAAGASDFIASCSDEEWRVKGKWSMVSLRGSDGIEGSLSGGIFMVSGHIGSEQIYTFYTTNDDGSFQPNKWTANSRTRIYEEDRKDGELVQWGSHFKNDFVYWFADPSSDIKSDFHIPRGSLQQSFALQ